MQDRDLFALVLGLTKPWFVVSVELDAERKELEMSIDFERCLAQAALVVTDLSPLVSNDLVSPLFIEGAANLSMHQV